MRTTDLYRRLGCSNNALHRLAARGILEPTRPADPANGGGRWGYSFEWNDAEQRAAAAVVAFVRSHLMEPGKSPTGQEARDDALRSIAACARTAAPGLGHDAPRWLMVLADGSCVHADDAAAAAWPEHRTLIPIEQIAAEG